MRKLFIITVLILSLFSVNVMADGGIVMPDYQKHITSPEQKAAIILDGNKETLILSVKMMMDEPSDFAWVVPIQSSVDPVVTEGDIQIFSDIAFQLRKYSSGRGGFPFFIGAGSMDQSVQVIEQKKVDIYDITVLKATDASDLVNWLNDNGYHIDEGSIPTLQHYANQQNFYFIANKINLSNKYSDITFSEIDKNCVDVLIESRAPFYYYGAFSEEELIGIFSSWFKNIPECKDASPNRTAILYSLKAGVSTPLKIEFYPNQPFYPMKMTSINDGDVTASVYILSKKPMKDSVSLMETENMVRIYPENFRSVNLTDQEYLTYLTFSGPTSQLDRDSFFTETEFDERLDPNYISPMEQAAIAATNLFLILLMVLMLLFPLLIFVPFIIGFFYGHGAKRIKNANYSIIILIFITIIVFFIPALLFGDIYRYDIFRAAILSLLTLPSLYFGFFSASWKWGTLKWILIGIGITVLVFIVFILISSYGIFF